MGLRMNCYPTAQEMLENGEESVLIIHRSFRSSLGLIFILVLSMAGVMHLVINYGSEYRWAAILPVILVLELVRRYLNDLYIITRDQVVHQQGRVSLRYSVPSIRCIDLRSISVEQSLWGRIINFGYLGLATAAQAGNEVTMDGILAPSELAKLIDDLRVESQRAGLEDPNQDRSADNHTSKVSND